VVWIIYKFIHEKDQKENYLSSFHHNMKQLGLYPPQVEEVRKKSGKDCNSKIGQKLFWKLDLMKIYKNLNLH